MGIQFAHSAAPMAESFTESEGLLPVSRQSKDEFEVERVVAGVSKEDMSSLVRCLYWSHFLSRWRDKMWEFAVGLLMLQVWPDSLLLVAIYGLVETTSVATLGVLVGELVDTLPRLRVPCKCRHTLDSTTFIEYTEWISRSSFCGSHLTLAPSKNCPWRLRHLCDAGYYCQCIRCNQCSFGYGHGYCGGV